MPSSNAAEITLEYLHECFEPDYEKGILYWKERPRHHFKTERGWNTFNSQCAYKQAYLRLNKKGYHYVYMRLMGLRKVIRVHRILYQMYHNKMLSPNIHIDHIDGNRGNNSISNLRECNNTQNQYNSKKRKDNTTGIKGVSNLKRGQRKYRAYVERVGKRYSKCFYTIKEAETWVKEKRAELHGEFANDGEV